MNSSTSQAGPVPCAEPQAALRSASFSVLRGNRRVQCSYEYLFVTGHDLWLARDYDKAADIFRHLTQVTDRGPRAHIFLAHCRVMCADFAGCSETLSEALPVLEYWSAHCELHDSFVLWKLGMYADVRRALERIICDYPELPTPCLLLGELLLRQGNRQQPPRFLREAIRRDHPQGSIALIARRELHKLRPAMPSALNTQPEGVIRII